MKVPCKECICLAICRTKVRDTRSLNGIDCIIAYNYVDYLNKDERPMYRQTRMNKVRKALGLKKKRRKRLHER